MEIRIDFPEWMGPYLAAAPPCATDVEKMRLAIALSRQNVERNTGGPFGAAVFERGSGRLIGAGVNSVMRLQNSVLHAEVIALMIAESKVKSFTLQAANLPEFELFTSCDPCAMCLGAILWSGVRRVVCGAGRLDASRVGFDEGPVFPESYEYLKQRGIQVETGLLESEARAVLDLYQSNNGVVYNGCAGDKETRRQGDKETRRQGDKD
jgi:tRNA(Arg) A34 adenosine deaminase TadA